MAEKEGGALAPSDPGADCIGGAEQLEKTLAAIVLGSAAQAKKKLKDRESLAAVMEGLKAEQRTETKNGKKGNKVV